MKLRARTSPLVIGLIALGLCACGGKSKGTGTGTSGTGAGTDTGGTASSGGTPFDQDAVKAQVSGTAAADLDGCSVDGAASLGDVMQAQKADLEADGAADESFSCKASTLTDGRWECTWEVTSGGSAFQIISQVNADGSLVAGQTLCIAPG